MQNQYDVTIITLRPGAQGKVLPALEPALANETGLLACWYSEIGALNRILIIRTISDAAAAIAGRTALLTSDNPFGVGEFITGMTMDTFVAFDFLPPIAPGDRGPFYEVRTYTLNAGGLTPTIERWRAAVPGRTQLSPLLAAMSSVSGPVARFIHIWPYKSLDERARIRAKAIADGVWPPQGGAPFMAAQQTDIYRPATFSPLR